MLIDEQPECLIGDKAYDSDGLDRRLMEQRGLELIAPHWRRSLRSAAGSGAIVFD